MKFGLAFASSIGIDSASSLELCRRAEALGFDSVWCGEHVVWPSQIDSPYPYSPDGVMPGDPETPVPDPLIWLAYVAAAAPTLKLGTCVLILPQRNPLILAKELATLDRLSGGRVELGIGVGWMKEEFDALGAAWDHRGARTDEYVEAMKVLWAGPEAEFHGRFVDFPPVTCSPRPINGTIPIVTGGDSPIAIRRAGRLADGYFPGSVEPEKLARLIADLGDAATAAGRSPQDITVNAMLITDYSDPLAGVEQYREMGISRVMVPAFFFAGPNGLDLLETFAKGAISRQ
ncbi:MAG: LLM class F420-dependent oxidoreductase [Halieaceae bacterium]|jgi:probable F420-dependent oxidoreductase|nr:LLM class F420-dependent oxidoreductase [Halieaceae bacterium]